MVPCGVEVLTLQGDATSSVRVPGGRRAGPAGPAPVRTASTHLYSTTEPSSRRQVPPADREASADWLARQGLVAPGASPEMHEKAKAARLKRKGGGALVVREKRALGRRGVRDAPIDGGWSIVVATRDVARELRLAAAAAACDFGALAKAMSLEPVSGGEEGRIGWVEHGAGEQLATDGMLPAEARAAVDDAMHDLDLATKPRKKVRGAATDLAGACAGKTYAMVTMGCQMNAADSERLEGSLRQLGLVEAPDPKLANVVVLNTCSIREHAETKVYSYVGPQAKRKRNGEDVTIVVAGCVAQQEGARLLRRAPEVDVVMGPQYANRLPDVLERAMVHGEQVAATSASYGATSTSSAASGAALDAPTAPRRATSTPTAATCGPGATSTTCSPPRTSRRHGDMRVRFVTSHPRYITDAVIDAVADHGDVIMPVFHMPASGDDAMLRLMGRATRRTATGPSSPRSGPGCRTRRSRATSSSAAPASRRRPSTATPLMDAEFDACMTAAYSPRPGTPMAHWDGAADAFATLGVDVSKLADRETAADDAGARAATSGAGRGAPGGLRNGDDDEDAWDATVKAKADALAALDRAAAAPRPRSTL
ncbi:N6-isopentenyladenosine methylthiotransferase [Aureococcus anophagefferens]|nr:N6-isopentenyladenosine methylthiotransferase [Aureococcus anophagefferens]